MYVDAQKAAIYSALMAADANDQMSASLAFWRRPDEIRTTGTIMPKGQLRLIPAVPLSLMSTKNNPAGTAPSLGIYSVNGCQTEFCFTLAPSKPPIKAAHELSFAPDALVSPYWWVSTTHIEKDANMEAAVTVNNGITIPILINSRDLEPFSRLCKYKAKEAAQSLRGGANVQEEVAPEKKIQKQSSGAAVPKAKRQRRGQ